MKILLTSTGFDNPRVMEEFQEMLDKPAGVATAVFIPTGLNTVTSREYIPVFLDDLLKAGISRDRILTYDLDEPFGVERLLEYDVVFVCPGSTEYLISRVSTTGFDRPLRAFLDAGGIYVGVSAGSEIAAKNLPEGLGYVDLILETHARKGHPAGNLDTSGTPVVRITDNQAVMVRGMVVSVIE